MDQNISDLGQNLNQKTYIGLATDPLSNPTSPDYNFGQQSPGHKSVRGSMVGDKNIHVKCFYLWVEMNYEIKL